MLLNPGVTSRNYLVGIARAADRLGVLAQAVELEPIWSRIRDGGPGGLRDVVREIVDLCERQCVTHVIGYAHNGVFDFGPYADPLGASAEPVGLFTHLGLRHILLWTDHPNWAMGASALEPKAALSLAHPNLIHVVKSRAAADEVRDVLGWANVRAMDMAEDCELIQPASDVSAVHDVVTIMGDVTAVPKALEPMLEQDDPDPTAIMRLLAPVAQQQAQEQCDDPHEREACSLFAAALIECKINEPHRALHAISQMVASEHAEALHWLRGDARRWYALVNALQGLTRWRRMFWLVWLGERVDVGVYGSAAEPLGLVSPVGPVANEHWVPYDKQPEVYARGRVAVNINASHDEEGLTHKPFQIGACGACCVHHVSRGLERAFEPGQEILTFERGPELLDHVRSLAGDDAKRQQLAGSMLERTRRDHTWDDRLTQLLAIQAPVRVAQVESSA